MIVDAAGVVHEGNTALARLHAVSNAPIFSYDESSLAVRLSAARFSQCSTAAARQLPLRFASWGREGT